MTHFLTTPVGALVCAAIFVPLAFAAWAHIRLFGPSRTLGAVLTLLFAATLAVWLVAPFMAPTDGVQIRDRDFAAPSLGAAIMAALALLGLILGPRLAFGLRALTFQPPEGDTEVDHATLPLPSQWAAIEALVGHCGGSRNGLERTPFEGKVVTLDAGWGTGKTFVVRSFERICNATPHAVGPFEPPWAARLPRGLQWLVTGRARGDTHPPPIDLVVSHYNAWQNQMEPDPEFAIVQHLISDRRVMWPCGWLTIPAWRILATLVLSGPARGLGYRFKMFSFQIEGAPGPAPSRIRWSRTVARLAWSTWRRSPAGRRNANLVLVIDDVDRCASVVAQRYVTLLRRGLTLPHLAIVMPYTPDQLRYKVFDPLSVDLPDLGSSMEAAHVEMLMGDARRNGATAPPIAIVTDTGLPMSMGVNSPFRRGALGSGEDILIGLSQDYDDLRSKRLEGSTEGAKREQGGVGVIDANWNSALNVWEILRRERLNQSYLEMMLLSGHPEAARPSPARQLIRQLESKYVSDANVRFPRLSYRDCAYVILGLQLTREVLFGLDDDVPYGKDGVFDALVHVMRGENRKECERYLGPSAGDLPVFRRPAFLDAATRERLEADFTFEAMKTRISGAASYFERLLHVSNAPSIRTVIAATERLLQDAPVRRVAAFADRTLPARPDRFDEARYRAILLQMDRIILHTYSFMVE
ncbi:MAG: hypothetical protein ACU0CO_05830 [Shimia sp.]